MDMQADNRLKQRVRLHMQAWLRGEGLPPWVHWLVGLGIPAWLLGWNMWIVRKFTVDDAYISFRYARNLADGLGLVYNAGERIEGYTNFLWTVLLAGGIELGIDPHVTSKVLGGAAGLGESQVGNCGVSIVAVFSRMAANTRSMPPEGE